MSAPTDTTTELMTEHLQYAPITLIDDVINSANAILYQSMDAFETYIRDTLIPSIPSSTSTATTTKKAFDLDASIGEVDEEKEELYKELEFGMAQVETLLENAVDRNFDAFELYVLRNVFNVPDEVEGYLRLQHHQGLDFTTTPKQDQELDSAIQLTRKRIQEANKMTMLLQREKAKNEAHLQPLRENARKLAFLNEATKSNDGYNAYHSILIVVLPLSETTDFLTDQLRTLISLLRALRALPTNAKQGSADEMRKVYLEQLVAKKLADAGMLHDLGENWKEQRNKYDKIASLEDLRKLDRGS